jgi:hypothetical protein
VHGPFGQQLEDGRADVAALAAPAPATTSATRAAWAAEAESEAAARIESELETAATAGAEREPVAMARVAERAGVARVLLAQVVTKVVTEVAAGLPALLMKCSPVARSEAEAPGRWGEWVGHIC